jgi:hypothetical protein
MVRDVTGEGRTIQPAPHYASTGMTIQILPGNANLPIGVPGLGNKSILFISLTGAYFRGYIKANPYSREFRWQTMN